MAALGTPRFTRPPAATAGRAGTRTRQALEDAQLSLDLHGPRPTARPAPHPPLVGRVGWTARCTFSTPARRGGARRPSNRASANPPRAVCLTGCQPAGYDGPRRGWPMGDAGVPVSDEALLTPARGRMGAQVGRAVAVRGPATRRLLASPAAGSAAGCSRSVRPKVLAFAKGRFGQTRYNRFFLVTLAPREDPQWTRLLCRVLRARTDADTNRPLPSTCCSTPDRTGPGRCSSCTATTCRPSLVLGQPIDDAGAAG